MALTIDLRELFGVNFTGHDALKQAIGQAIIDKIVERTKSGKSVYGKQFAGYSNEYADSPDFKAFGKSKSKINLTMSGEMLDTMDIVDVRGDKITIGWSDDTENAKAYNHNTGDTVKKRRFFDITSDELKQIKSDFIDAVKEETKGFQSEEKRTLAQLLNNLSVKDQLDISNRLNDDES